MTAFIFQSLIELAWFLTTFMIAFIQAFVEDLELVSNAFVLKLSNRSSIYEIFGEPPFKTYLGKYQFYLPK
jgi:hypothetical protein